MTADVDVVIPVRNGGRLLRLAVDSVLEQDGVNVRVIVVDDGSTDGCAERLPQDSRITVVRGPARGIPTALNVGTATGRAPYVARQDADDESVPGRLSAQLDFLSGKPGIGLVATGFDVVVGDRTVATMLPALTGMLDKNPICAGSTVLRRAVSDAVGGYRSQFALASDYDMWLRCAAHAGVAILPIVGYRYRLSAGMSTIRRASKQASYARLARASARARLAGDPDPVDADAATAMDDISDDDRDVTAWWAREFAALGAPAEALRCAVRLPPAHMLRVLPTLVRRPQSQGAWT